MDDGSTDDTVTIAAQYADKVVRLPDGPHGPGYARNRGFEMTLGACVAFVNADVMVRSHTLRRFYEALKRDRDVGAVFGFSADGWNFDPLAKLRFEFGPRRFDITIEVRFHIVLIGRSRGGAAIDVN